MPFTQLAIGRATEKNWWCATCAEEIDLDKHGRCGAYGSDAVDRIGRGTLASADRASGRLNLFAPRRLRGTAVATV